MRAFRTRDVYAVTWRSLLATMVVIGSTHRRSGAAESRRSNQQIVAQPLAIKEGRERGTLAAEQAWLE